MSNPSAADTFRHADEALVILADALGNDVVDPQRCRQALGSATENLVLRFERGESVIDLVRLRAKLVDHVLLQLWQKHADNLSDRAALVAVGGYGRGELHPYSDVDILILHDVELPAQGEAAVSAFVTALWDAGLEIGHSVRTIAECRHQATEDLTIATTLTEARQLSGPESLFNAMQAAINASDVWPADRYFAAKLEEQRVRHLRYDDTAYKLEPNVKGSPGGLRDIQMIGWVAKRHFGVRTLDELVAHGFLSPGQRRTLHEGQAFLWRVRFALHVLTGRREDRLLFDHQTRLAAMLGYEDASYTLAVEQMMQRYYAHGNGPVSPE